MKELNNWNYTNIFSGKDAAALMLGIDPSDPNADLSRIAPVLAGMLNCYNPLRYFPDRAPLSERPYNLVSTWLEGCINENLGESITRSEEGDFDAQVFSSKELARWLSENSYKSVYQFDRSVIEGVEVGDDAQTEKPLATRERDTLLTIIAALAKAAKINIDPPGKAAGYIEGLTTELGAGVSKRAIEEHLKKIPDALRTRMK